MRKSKRGYPKVMDNWSHAPAPASTPEQWTSQPEAAAQLDVSLLRIGLIIANGHLAPVTSATGEAGVSTSSLVSELRWRREATIRAKLLRAVRDTLDWL